MVIESSAGFILEGIRNHLRNDKNQSYWQELLAGLSDFIIDTNVESGENWDPICAAYDNMISRGLPTLPSLFIEDELGKAFSLTQKIINDRTGEIHFPLRPSINSTQIDLLKRALHIFDPRLNRSSALFYPLESWEKQLDSNPEREFFHRVMPGNFGDHIIQLVEPQRSFTSIIEESKWLEKSLMSKLGNPSKDFIDQRTDFTMHFPAYYDAPSAMVVEIDGPHHLKEGQKVLDARRDKICGILGWAKTVRINTFELHDVPTEKLARIQKFLAHPYAETVRKNYANPIWSHKFGLAALQLALTPFLVARIQKVLLHFIAAGVLVLDKNKWRIAIFERDVPGANLAVQDFQSWMNVLLELEGKGRKLPQIEYTVYKSPEFRECELAKVSSCSEMAVSQVDLLIDASMLLRYGFIEPEEDLLQQTQPTHIAVVRSAYHHHDSRKIKCTQPVQYHLSKSNDANLRFILQNVFRKSEFLEGQKRILERTLVLKDAIALLPTGAGKSLTYQMSTLLQPGIAMIVDPLKSLMRDQNDNLLALGIDATTFINSSLSPVKTEYLLERMTKGKYQFIFISPERMQIRKFRDYLEKMKNYYFTYCVIDEAHCVSEWGHDFRTAYLLLGRNARRHIPIAGKNNSGHPNSAIPMIALTGTASFDVLEDVKRDLAIWDEQAIIRPKQYRREELHFQIVEVKIPTLNPRAKFWDAVNVIGNNKQKELALLLERMHSHFGATCPEDFFNGKNSFSNAGLIFCPHKGEKSALGIRQVANYITKHIGMLESQVDIFAGADDSLAAIANDLVQDKFKKDEISLLVATKAFGMGIDKPNIRFTIHFNMPQSLESFYQEAGRAGRDHRNAQCVILYSPVKNPEGNGTTVDKQVMFSFHEAAFKGVQKEKSILYELLNKIYYPDSTRVKNLNLHVNEIIDEPVVLSPWPTDGFKRLYANADEYPFSYGYIDLKKMIIETERRPERKIVSEEKSREILGIVLHEMQNKKPAGHAIETWLAFRHRQNPCDGIETLLETMAIGENKIVQIGFANNTLQSIADLIGMGDEIEVVRKAYEYCNSAVVFVEKLGIEYRRRIGKEISDYHKKLIYKYFFKIRDGADTFKAIYRFLLIGIVEDYEVDYNAKIINVTITRRPEQEYIENLQKYISQFVSMEEAIRQPQIILSYKGESIIQKCLGRLVDFIYEKIASKRRAAIDTMESTIKDGIGAPERFADRVNSYFDSRYTPEMRDILYDYSIENAYKYMELTKGELDSVSHLHGACDRLIVENPENPILYILRAYAKFLLNDFSSEEALENLLKGWQMLVQQNKWSRKEYLNHFNRFYLQCLEYDRRVQPLLDRYILNEHLNWIKQFNQERLARRNSA